MSIVVQYTSLSFLDLSLPVFLHGVFGKIRFYHFHYCQHKHINHMVKHLWLKVATVTWSMTYIHISYTFTYMNSLFICIHIASYTHSLSFIAMINNHLYSTSYAWQMASLKDYRWTCWGSCIALDTKGVMLVQVLLQQSCLCLSNVSTISLPM